MCIFLIYVARTFGLKFLQYFFLCCDTIILLDCMPSKLIEHIVLIHIFKWVYHKELLYEKGSISVLCLN